MNICVIGTGYVGLVTGTCFSELGNKVTCVDINESKVNMLKEGKSPIFELGLEDLLKRNIREKKLIFTTNAAEAIQNAKVVFIAVGTPQKENGEANLEYVFKVAEQIGKNLNNHKVIVTKSTVPVGTGHKVKEIIKNNLESEIDFDIVSNPEFLREGEAINDFLFPDRVVVGVESEKAKKIMEELYKGVARTNHPLMITDICSSELIKYASNGMLATRISFMNEIARVCEKVGADVKDVSKGVGLDSRIGTRFLQAGAGYGGSCFPKDTRALIKIAENVGLEMKIVNAVDEVNEEQKKLIVPKLKKFLPELNGKTIGIWGLAFKPKTDDMREAPSIIIINELQKLGAKIRAFDPEAQENAKNIFNDIEYFETPFEAAKDCDALLVLTEWNTFRSINQEELKSVLKQLIMIDARNVYSPEKMRSLGYSYESVGRK